VTEISSRCRAVLLILALLCEPQFVCADQPATHRAGQSFSNPYVSTPHPGLWGFLRARFFSGAWAGYDAAVYRVPTRPARPLATGEANDNATVTWIGHATVLIQHQGVNMLTDPMFSDYASPLPFAGPKRITPPGLSLAQLPPIDIVVISHNHYDHLDAPTIRSLGNGPRYYVPLGIRPWLEAQGIDADRITEMDWWESAAVQVNSVPLRITATPSQHFSGRGAFDRNATLWASWAVTWNDYTVWFAGDTGYNDQQFEQIGDKLPHIDLGIIPIGAYEPRWFMQTVHVDPSEAVQIHQDIGASRSMGVHWGTFLLSAEQVDAPSRALAAALKKANLDPDAMTTFAIGETRHYAPAARARARTSATSRPAPAPPAPG